MKLPFQVILCDYLQQHPKLPSAELLMDIDIRSKAVSEAVNMSCSVRAFKEQPM